MHLNLDGQKDSASAQRSRHDDPLILFLDIAPHGISDNTANSAFGTTIPGHCGTCLSISVLLRSLCPTQEHAASCQALLPHPFRVNIQEFLHAYMLAGAWTRLHVLLWLHIGPTVDCGQGALQLAFALDSCGTCRPGRSKTLSKQC